MTEAGPRILIVRLSAIGDVLVTSPVSRALREAFPQATLGWVVETKAAGFLEGNPYLDEVFVWNRSKGLGIIPSLWEISSRLRGRGWDWAIDCQGNLRSALVSRLSGARTVVGNRGAKEQAERFYHVKVDRNAADLSSRQRCLDLLAPLGVKSQDRRMVAPVTDGARQQAGELLAESGILPGAGYACLVPATTWAQKHWLPERWSELADRLSRDLGLTPVVMGGPADAALTERIIGEARTRCISLVGRTSLSQASAVIAGAQATVAVDTALMHASVAVGTPTVVVAGASFWPGFQDYERFRLIREPMTCSPCLHRPTCDGRYDCMSALTAGRVIDAIRELLAGDRLTLPVLGVPTRVKS